MEAQTVQRVAENESPRQTCVIERFDPKVIACAKQLLAAPIPNGESEIANQVLHAILGPRLVRKQDQFCIGSAGRYGNSRRPKRFPQFRLRVNPRVGNNPDSPVDTARLLVRRAALDIERCVAQSIEQRMSEANFAIAPNFLRVRPAKPQKRSHAAQQVSGNRSTVRIHDACDSAHDSLKRSIPFGRNDNRK